MSNVTCGLNGNAGPFRRFLFVISILAGMTTGHGQSVQSEFFGIPTQSNSAITFSQKNIVAFLAGTDDQKTHIQKLMHQQSSKIQKLIGMRVDLNQVERISVFASGKNPEDPDGLVIKSPFKGEQLLSNFRQMMLKSEEMDTSDLPAPKMTTLGFKEFRFRNALIAAEVKPGVMASTRSRNQMAGIHKSLTESQPTASFFKEILPKNHGFDPRRHLFSGYMRDLSQLKLGSQGAGLMKYAKGMYFSGKTFGRDNSLHLDLTLLGKDRESSNLIYQSALGLKALTVLGMKSKLSGNNSLPKEEKESMSLLLKILTEKVTIRNRRSNNAVSITARLDDNITERIRESLFKRIRDKVR